MVIREKPIVTYVNTMQMVAYWWRTSFRE